MSAFERILSGFPDIDRLLDNIRLGDNVVWRVKSLDEFRCFAEPFAEQALADGRTVIYMRFAGHEPLLRPRPGLKIREFDPDKGFEAFTVDIYNCITENGREAFYVFDSLSELQSVWYTDLMMGDFFGSPVRTCSVWTPWPAFPCSGDATPLMPWPGYGTRLRFFWMCTGERACTTSTP